MKRQFRIKVQLNDAQVAEIIDKANGKKVKKLKVKIEASHSGIVNKNFFFYTPRGMADGVHTFVEPYQKPVQVNHDNYEAPIGRVLDSRYVDYADLNGDIIDSIKTTENPEKLVKDVNNFVKGNIYLNDEYKGLGHTELIAEITDEEAIEKVLDKRYLTVSISGGVDSAVCSACGTDKMSDEACDHFRGDEVDGETVFYIGGLMDFKEVSYVNVPADENAISEVISDSAEDSELIEQQLEILDYEIDTGDSSEMKLKDLLAKATAVADALAALGLDSCALSDEDYDKLRKTSFLFAQERVLPINDKAHVLAAYEAIKDVEEEELKDAKPVLDRKFVKLFGKDVSYTDALKQFQDELAAQAEEDTNVEAQEVKIDVEDLAEQLVPKVVDAVVGKLKDTLTVSDGFAGSRIEALELELESLEDENKQLTEAYKKVIINQILITEDKVGDEAYKAKLEDRGLDSLFDKLEDLGFGIANAEEDNSSDNGNDDDVISDEANLDDASDGNVQDDDSGDDAGNDEGTQVEVLDTEVIKAEYKKRYREKGTVAANAYLKELRDNKQIPENFTF
jgi:hypothetical protein